MTLTDSENGCRMQQPKCQEYNNQDKYAGWNNGEYDNSSSKKILI